ncbi:MAG: type II toxin-antitoxin system HicA family toxin [Planctomycetaceae bacterium]|nr:type II toxin-antitoxin system HicA family toxin [Planctomycetaceae bacterium]
MTIVSPGDTINESMGPKHRRTLAAIFEDPVRSNIAWRDIEAMLAAAGAEITEGSGSRVRIALNGVRAVFHRPHPQKETDKGAVKSMRRFLTEAGVTP